MVSTNASEFSKKRAAPSSSAGASASKKPKVAQKKASSSKGSSTTAAAANRKDRAKTAASKKKEELEETKRKVPITEAYKPPRDIDHEDDEEDGGFDGGPDGDDEDQDVDMDAGPSSSKTNGKGREKGPSNGMNVNGQMDPAEYKKLSKEEKQTLRSQNPHRNTLLPSHPLLQNELLPAWELARKSDISPSERKEAVSALWGKVKGRVGEVKGGHKGGRVLQTIIKYGSKEERLALATELKGDYEQMMKSKYSKFLIAKLIRFCPSIRGDIITELQPSVPNLLLHSNAIVPLTDFFDMYANSLEKRRLVRAFYPKEVLLFGAGGDAEGLGVKGMDGKVKGEGVKGLVGLMEGMGENLASKQRILDDLQKVIFNIFNQPQKAALTQALFHRVVLEYLQCLYKFLPDEQADKKMHELLDEAVEHLPDIVHTKDGSSVVREMLARGVAKDRRNILRPFKKHMEKVCQDAEAQTVLFTAFDVVDDTKMMAKDVIGPIGQIAYDIAMDKTGRKVLYYLLAPRSKRYFMQNIVNAQAETDTLAAKTSKKDTEVRRTELRQAITPILLQLVADKGEDLLRDAGASLLVNEIMLNVQADKGAAADGLLVPLATPYPYPAPADSDPDPATSHILDLGHAARVYKTILTGGHFDAKTKAVEVKDAEFTATFARKFMDAISDEEAGGEANVFHIAVGNAPFTLVEMIASLKEDTRRRTAVKDALQQPERISAIDQSLRKGAKVLHAAVQAL